MLAVFFFCLITRSGCIVHQPSLDTSCAMPLARDGRVGDSDNSFVFIARYVVRMHFITIMSAPLRFTVNCYIHIFRRRKIDMIQRVLSVFVCIFKSGYIMFITIIFMLEKIFSKSLYARSYLQHADRIKGNNGLSYIRSAAIYTQPLARNV